MVILNYLKYALIGLLLPASALAGLPPTTSKISTDTNNVTTFNYQFPNFTGTHTGTTLSLGVNSIAGGGTGQTTKSAAFDALSPMLASGDIIYGGTSGTGTRLAKGSNGQVLTLVSGAPAWSASNATALSAKAIFTVSQSVTASTALTFQSAKFDPNSILTLATGRATIPVGYGGIYYVSLAGISKITGGTGWHLWKNGSLESYMFETAVNLQTSGGTLVQLADGDYVDIRPDTSGSTLNSTAFATFSIFRVGN